MQEEHAIICCDWHIRSGCNSHPGLPHPTVSDDVSPYVLYSSSSAQSICLFCAVAVFKESTTYNDVLTVLTEDIVHLIASERFATLYWSHEQIIHALMETLAVLVLSNLQHQQELSISNSLLWLLQCCPPSIFDSLTTKLLIGLMGSSCRDGYIITDLETIIRLTVLIMDISLQRSMSSSREFLDCIECLLRSVSSSNVYFLQDVPKLLNHAVTLNNARCVDYLNSYCQQAVCNLVPNSDDALCICNALGIALDTNHVKVTDAAIAVYISMLQNKSKTIRLHDADAIRLSTLIISRPEACWALYSAVSEMLFDYLQYVPDSEEIIMALESIVACPEFANEVDYAIELILGLISSTTQQHCYLPLMRLLSLMFGPNSIEAVIVHFKPKTEYLVTSIVRLTELPFDSNLGESCYEETWNLISSLILAIISAFSFQDQTYQSMWNMLYSLLKDKQSTFITPNLFQLFNKLFVYCNPLKIGDHFLEWLVDTAVLAVHESSRGNYSAPITAEAAFSFLYTMTNSLPPNLDLVKSRTSLLTSLLLYARSCHCLEICDDSSFRLLQRILVSVDDLHSNNVNSEPHLRAVYTKEPNVICNFLQNSIHYESIVASLQLVSLQLMSKAVNEEHISGLYIPCLQSLLSSLADNRDHWQQPALFHSLLYILRTSLQFDPSLPGVIEISLTSVRFLYDLFRTMSSHMALYLVKCTAIWNWILSNTDYQELKAFRTLLVQSEYFSLESYLHFPSIYATLCENILETTRVDFQLRYLESLRDLLRNEDSEFTRAHLPACVAPFAATFVNMNVEVRWQLQEIFLLIMRTNPTAIPKVFFEENWHLLKLNDSLQEDNLFFWQLAIADGTRSFKCIPFDGISFQKKIHLNWATLTPQSKTISITILANCYSAIDNFNYMQGVSPKTQDELIDLVVSSVFSSCRTLNKAGFKLAIASVFNFGSGGCAAIDSESAFILKREKAIMMLATKAVEACVLNIGNNIEAAEFIMQCLACDFPNITSCISSLVSLYIPKIMSHESGRHSSDWSKQNPSLAWKELVIWLRRSPSNHSDSRDLPSNNIASEVSLSKDSEQDESRPSHPRQDPKFNGRNQSEQLSPPLGHCSSSWFTSGVKFTSVENDQRLNSCWSRRRLNFA